MEGLYNQLKDLGLGFRGFQVFTGFVVLMGWIFDAVLGGRAGH